MATHSSTLAWKIPWMEEPDRLQSIRLKESDMMERLHFVSFHRSFWRRKWQPTPVFLPGESHGRRGLVGYSLWVAESDMTKQLTHTYADRKEMAWHATPVSLPRKSHGQKNLVGYSLRGHTTAAT